MKHAHIYTLIAYRPDGYDSRCRTYSPSAFETFVFVDSAQLVAKAAAMWFENDVLSRKDYDLSPWEFTVLIDGVDENSWWTIHPYDDVDDEGRDPRDEFGDIRDAIGTEHERFLQVEKDQMVAAEARRKRDEAELLERRRIEMEVEEQALLRSLIEKHGIPGETA